MEFETKILSKGIQEMLYNSDKTVGTAESCTGGRIAEALISVPGASNYFKGGVISYTNADEFHKEVRKNVTSEEGKKLMFKRDNEAEGTFGDLKENIGSPESNDGFPCGRGSGWED